MMKYKDIRSQVRTGDTFFTAEGALFSRIIRFFTKSDISHVGMFVWLGKRLFCVESIEGTGVRLIQASVLLRDKECWWWGRVPNLKYTEDEISERVFSDDPPRIGSAYDMKGALLSIFFDTKSQLVYCSEYVMKKLGIELFASTNGSVPRDIANLGEFFHKIEK